MTTLRYDPQSDTLYIDTCAPMPRKSQTKSPAASSRGSTPPRGKVENIEVMFFRERFAAGVPFELRISLEMQSASRL
jgi:hypothetical protein